jgi:hypothetical protein
MRHALLLAVGVAAVSGAGAAELTTLENRWLRGALPVLEYAREQRLPVDIVVQPQNAAGLSPLALGFVDGRCKLVLSMRGNAQAEALLDGLAVPLASAVIETVVAHEVGHCWRHVQGAWTAPAAAGRGDVAEQRREMEATRQEEGYADLVGLAWTQRRHATQYGAVHAWLRGQRGGDGAPTGNHHDTGAWLALAVDGRVFDASLATPFEQAQALLLQAPTLASLAAPRGGPCCGPAEPDPRKTLD